MGIVRTLILDFKNTWRGLANSTEQYVLRYESKHLKRVGSSMGYFVTLAAKVATKEALKYTALASKKKKNNNSNTATTNSNNNNE